MHRFLWIFVRAITKCILIFRSYKISILFILYSFITDIVRMYMSVLLIIWLRTSYRRLVLLFFHFLIFIFLAAYKYRTCQHFCRPYYLTYSIWECLEAGRKHQSLWPQIYNSFLVHFAVVGSQHSI